MMSEAPKGFPMHHGPMVWIDWIDHSGRLYRRCAAALEWPVNAAVGG